MGDAAPRASQREHVRRERVVPVLVLTGSAWEHHQSMDCLACELATGALPLPGGLIYETTRWRVEHCVGPLGVGTLVVKPKRHVLRVADLNETEAHEMGPLLRRVAAAVDDLTRADQVYVCLWSHGPVHLHYVVQPATADVVAEFGAYGPRMQAAMFARGEPVDPQAANVFAQRARRWFAENTA
jgi:diadenosine tetraphosphate (Ap4A) HIT family hydrolase